MQQENSLSAQNTAGQAAEARLIALVLDTVTSVHSRRSYRTGLVRFFSWIRKSEPAPMFLKALVGEYRAALLDAGLSAATINLQLAPVRRLAREMADNGLLDPAGHGTRLGNWLTKEQANDRQRPKPEDLTGKRDRAILALLLVVVFAGPTAAAER